MVIPYITFCGECREVLEFYRTVFNGTVRMLQTYGSYVPENVRQLPEDIEAWVLHGEMEICGALFWFADEVAEPVIKGNMVKLTLTVPTAKEAQKIFDGLNVDAYINLPPTETFYSAFHGGITDKYGVSWNITAEEAPGSTQVRQ